MMNKKIKPTRLLIASILILSMLAAPAAAHGVYMSSEVNGDNLKIHAYYQGGDPMANCDVEVMTYDAAGKTIPYLTGKTDASGDYEFAVKNGVTAYRVKVVEGEHAVTKRIDIDAPSGSGSDSGSDSGSSSWIFGTEGPSLFTIGAGLGWIVGIAGIIMYLQARKMKNS